MKRRKKNNSSPIDVIYVTQLEGSGSLVYGRGVSVSRLPLSNKKSKDVLVLYSGGEFSYDLKTKIYKVHMIITDNQLHASKKNIGKPAATIILKKSEADVAAKKVYYENKGSVDGEIEADVTSKITRVGDKIETDYSLIDKRFEDINEKAKNQYVVTQNDFTNVFGITESVQCLMLQ